jgi:ribosomal protein S27AE
MQKVAGNELGEDSDDLQQWLEALKGCPSVNMTLLARCASPVHDGDEAMTWFYVEADATASVARRRCLACGEVAHLLDSEEHWTHPPMHACGTCGQSMFEVAVGLHVESGTTVTWLAVAVRCVGCGRLDGVTDMNVPSLPVDEVRSRV